MTYLKIASLLALGIALTRGADAQAPEAGQNSFDISVDETGVQQSLREPLRMPVLPRDLELSEATRRNFRPVISVSENLQVRLPLPLNAKVSRDRRTIVQYGDPLFRMHPQRLDIYWIGEDGEVRDTVLNRFDGESRLAISRDGYLAVAGGAFLSEAEPGEAKPKAVELYNPRGEPIADATVEPGRDLTHLVPLPEGRGVIFSTAPSKDNLSDNRLLLLEREQTRDVTPEGFGILQKVVALETSAFVQGEMNFGLFDLEEGELMWSRPETIRLIGPEAAMLSSDGRLLMLVTGDRVGAEAIYRWTLTVLDASSGKSLAQERLEGEFPSAESEVFADVGENHAVLRIGDQTRRVEIRSR